MNKSISENTSEKAILQEALQEALASIRDPYSGADVLTANVVKRIQIDETDVTLDLKFGYPIPVTDRTKIVEQIRQILQPLLAGGVLNVNVDWKINAHLPENSLKPIAGVKNIIAVAAGKGGVGKSTTAINLALAIHALGARVGILDADIYGPSQPHLLATVGKPEIGEDKRLKPIIKYGLQSMSMGYCVEDAAPMVWRGPMVSKAVQQLLQETAWDNLEYLIVDLPPGTGDIPLTLAQKIPVVGAIIITTPQDVALLDVKKSLMMLKNLQVPILGVVENMSAYRCTQCGHQAAIFGVGGGEKLANQYAVPLLAKIPLTQEIQEHSDLGMPSVVKAPEGEIANLYRELACQVTARLSLRERDYTAATPTILS